MYMRVPSGALKLPKKPDTVGNGTGSTLVLQRLYSSSFRFTMCSNACVWHRLRPRVEASCDVKP